MQSNREWFYAVNGEKKGPVTEDEIRQLLRNRMLSLTDLVWHPDFGPEWKTIRTVPAFMDNRAVIVNLQTTAPLTDAPKPVLQNGFVHFGSDERKEKVPLSDVPGENSSAWAAVSRAFNYMKKILFRSSSVAQWFSIGFCLWIAQMGSGGININPSNFKPDNIDSVNAFKAQIDQWLISVSDVFSDPNKLVGLGIALVVGIAFGYFFLWLQSRGIFMFLYRWYRPDASIGEAWLQSQRNNRSLFLWRVGYSLIMFFLSAVLCAFIWKEVAVPYLAADCVWRSAFEKPVLIGSFGFLTLFMVGLAVKELLYDFVVPIMDAQDVTTSEAWKATFSLCNQHPVGVLGYFVVKTICWFAASVAIGLILACTCCIAAIPLIIPFVSSVVLLPIYFFFRGYSLFYLEGWRADLLPCVGVKR